MINCKWCCKSYPNKKALNKHESNCEWKEKKEEWNKKYLSSIGKTFWYVSTDKYILMHCVLSEKYGFIKFINSKESELYNAIYIGEDYEYKVHECIEKAQERLDNLKKIYFQTFKYKPFLKESIIIKHMTELLYIENEITKKLEDFPNFNGIDFCDVSAGGIQIRGHHAEIKRFTYGSQPTIKYDFSNYIDVIEEFVIMWKSQDNYKQVSREIKTLNECEKYGWD